LLAIVGQFAYFDAALTDFSECEVHKVFPIRGSKNYDQLARFAEYFVGTQILVSGRPQQAMKLVDRNHGGCRIIDGR
jgi:hypothetical protein